MKQINNAMNNTDYELLDSGDGEKLERFGEFILSRPDPQALWRKVLPSSQWNDADGIFTRTNNDGSWSLKKNLPDRWNIDFAGLKFWIKPTPFKHVGIFPEQGTNWSWLSEKIRVEKDDTGASNGEIEVLNLFGYTGGASLACAQAGAKVVHIDGSKSAITWARENAELSGLDKKPIRWILDDARTFVKREIKRGRKYQGIIMDPPSFGHGPENEIWKIEQDLMPLVEQAFELLGREIKESTTPAATGQLFFLINGYAAGYSAIAYENVLRALVNKFGGSIERGELTIKEKGITGRSLPCGIYARWSIR